MTSYQVIIEVSSRDIEKLDALAAEWALTRSDAIKRLLDHVNRKSSYGYIGIDSDAPTLNAVSVQECEQDSVGHTPEVPPNLLKLGLDPAVCEEAGKMMWDGAAPEEIAERLGLSHLKFAAIWRAYIDYHGI